MITGQNIKFKFNNITAFWHDWSQIISNFMNQFGHQIKRNFDYLHKSVFKIYIPSDYIFHLYSDGGSDLFQT